MEEANSILDINSYIIVKNVIVWIMQSIIMVKDYIIIMRTDLLIKPILDLCNVKIGSHIKREIPNGKKNINFFIIINSHDNRQSRLADWIN